MDRGRRQEGEGGGGEGQGTSGPDMDIKTQTLGENNGTIFPSAQTQLQCIYMDVSSLFMINSGQTVVSQPPGNSR